MDERLNHSEYPDYGDELCSDTRGRLYVKQVSGGKTWYCHDCGQRGFISNGTTTPSETVKNVLHTLELPNLRQETVKQITLPSDFSLSTIPFEGQIWLNKYGITKDEQLKFQIGYSDRYKRLILPVFDKDGLIYWQGRYLKQPTKEHPKYLNIRQGGAKNVFFRRFCRQDGVSALQNNTSLVIVEDILSAIKVGRYTNTLALLGSYFPPSILKEVEPYENIYIHLDDDKWLTAIKEARKIHSLTGKSCKVNKTLLDPKELDDETLKGLYL